jgi:hypothetical protein
VSGRFVVVGTGEWAGVGGGSLFCFFAVSVISFELENSHASEYPARIRLSVCGIDQSVLSRCAIVFVCHRPVDTRFPSHYARAQQRKMRM